MSVAEIFLPLGFVSFGGPTTNVGLFERVFVEKFRSVSAERFAELLAVTSSLPGSTASEMALAIGCQLGGTSGALIALMLFTLPGLIAMLIVGRYSSFAESLIGKIAPQWIYVAAVSVIIVASLTLFQRICKSTLAMSIAVIAAAAALTVPAGYLPLIALGGGAIAVVLTPASTIGALGVALLGQPSAEVTHFSMYQAQVALTLLVISAVSFYYFIPDSPLVDFFTAGASVVGGGTAMLPFLQKFVDAETFLLLFSVSMCMPGPLSNLAAAVGVVVGGGSVLFGLCAWTAMTLPGVLLTFLALPVWQGLKGRYEVMLRALLGLNAAAVGLLAAGTIQLYASTIGTHWLRLFAVICGVALQGIWEVEPVFIVLAGLAGGVAQGVLSEPSIL